MQLLRFIPIKLTLCLVLGILLGSYFQLGIAIPLALTLTFLALLAWFFFKEKNKKSILFGVLVLMTTVCVGILSTALAIPENYRNHYSHQLSERNESWRLKILEVLKPTNFSHRYIAKAQSLENKKVSGKVLLSFPADSTASLFQVDDELLTFAKAEEIKPPLNPHQFDYRKYLEGLGISHQLRLNESNYIILENPSQTFYGMAASSRNKIITKLRGANFGDEELGIIQALLLGQRNDISEDTYNNYKNAGAVHILAVSGLHIGILLLLLQFLLRPLEYLRKGKTV